VSDECHRFRDIAGVTDECLLDPILPADNETTVLFERIILVVPATERLFALHGGLVVLN
jgi:hypothetical protein